MEQRRQEFDFKLFEVSQKVQQDSHHVAERADSFNRRMTWFFIVLAALEVFGTLAAVLVGLAFPNGVEKLVELFN